MEGSGLADALRPGEFLVAYDYGMGGLWGVVVAPSREAIQAKYPELLIADELHRGWMRGIYRADARPLSGWVTTRRKAN